MYAGGIFLYNPVNTIEIVFYIQREFIRMKNVKECPLCGSTRKRIFETIEDEGKRVSFHICHRCGLVYQSPRMDEDELAQFYEREYRIQRQETEDPIEKDLLMQDARARAILEME